MDEESCLNPEGVPFELPLQTTVQGNVGNMSSYPIEESSATLSSAFNSTVDLFSIRDMDVDDSGLFMEDGEPFLGDLTSFLDGDGIPSDLNFDPIENVVPAATGSGSPGDSAAVSRSAVSSELDDLLDMVMTANTSDSVNTNDVHHWQGSELMENCIESQYNLGYNSLSSSFPSVFDDVPVSSVHLPQNQQWTEPLPTSTCTKTEWNPPMPGIFGSGNVTTPRGVTAQQRYVPSAYSGVVHTKLEMPQVTAAYTSASEGRCSTIVTPKTEQPADDSCVSSTSPDFPGPSYDSPYMTAAQDDPYYPLPALEVILMSPEARFMHLVQTLCREFPAELRHFMLAVSGDRGITPPPEDGQVMSVKSMLELRREIEQVQPVDALLLERIITEGEQDLTRHERILKEILRITCHGDMSQWERKLAWGREERKRLQEETDNATSASALKRHCSMQKPRCLAGEVEGGCESRDFGLEDAADDVSVTSLDSDIEPDQTDLPHAFRYPKGPDLLRSNRDVAHPHLEAPVADSVCQTQFGKVKFSVYPGIRWGRDPLRKKKRLQRKLAEASKDGEADVFICDDLLEDLDMESSVDTLLDCLAQHNLRCPKAAEWHRSRTLASLERSSSSCRLSRPSTSHLIIRKMSDGAPFTGGQRAPARTMDREEFLTQLADGRMTLTARPPEQYNQLLVRRPEAAGRRGCSEPHSRGMEAGRARPSASCASLPSQRDISLASRVAKDLLSRQTRDLYRTSLLSSGKHEEADGGNRSLPGFGKPKRSLGERSSGGASFKPFQAASNDNHWKSLLESVYQPRSRYRSTASSDRKRSHDSSMEAKQRKQHLSLGAVRSQETSKSVKVSHPPTILLQNVPLISTTCRALASQKSQPVKQPLLLPKPTVSIPGDMCHSSIAVQSSSRSVGRLGSFSAARLSQGYDTFVGVAQSPVPLRTAGLPVVSGSGGGTELAARQEGGRMVLLEPEPEPEPAELEGDQHGELPPPDEDQVKAETAPGDAQNGRRTIAEPPSPKSLQARDRILRAMVSVSDDTDDVTSMHYHRPRHCDFRGLTIGRFHVEPGTGRGRLKIIYSARKIVYEFDYPPASEESEHRQLVNIEVKFSSVIALRSSAEELGIAVCQIPSVLVSRPSPEPVTHRGRPTTAEGEGRAGTYAEPRLRGLVSGDLRDSPLHLLQLSVAGCEAACRTLGRVSRRFHDMLCSPPQLDGYVPRWRLVPCSDAATSTAGPASSGGQEGSGAWLQSGQPQNCSCRYSCRSLDCPCSRASVPCGYGGSQCQCGPTCANTFNALLQEGVDVDTAREDTCLVQNVFAVNKPREIGRLLSERQPCPHCGRPVEIRSVVPMQRPCPHCAKPVVFSWCQRRLRDSRNHCLVCIGCSEVNFQHCLVCKFCTRRTHQHGPCTQCVARGGGGGGDQWRSGGGGRYVTAEGQLFSRRLMSELQLTSELHLTPELQLTSAGGAEAAGGAAGPTDTAGRTTAA